MRDRPGNAIIRDDMARLRFRADCGPENGSTALVVLAPDTQTGGERNLKE